jgi:hypothetical protein
MFSYNVILAPLAKIAKMPEWAKYGCRLATSSLRWKQESTSRRKKKKEAKLKHGGAGSGSEAIANLRPLWIDVQGGERKRVRLLVSVGLERRQPMGIGCSIQAIDFPS